MANNIKVAAFSISQKDWAELQEAVPERLLKLFKAKTPQEVIDLVFEEVENLVTPCYDIEVASFATATDLAAKLPSKPSAEVVGRVLKKLGFASKMKRVGGSPVKVYLCKEIEKLT